MTIEEKNELTDYILRLIRDRKKKNQEPDVFDLYSVLGHIVALRVEMKSEWSEESYKVGIQRVLDNPESYGLTKNTRKQSEWSEEDEAALNKIIAHFDWTGNNRFTKDDCEWAQSWLKSLKDRVMPQPKKEWSEWTDKEKEYLNAIIYTLREIKSQPLVRLEDWDGYISFLESLQPWNRWKPTDEQMEVLLKYAEKNNQDGSVLTSLYQDLKIKV